MRQMELRVKQFKQSFLQTVDRLSKVRWSRQFTDANFFSAHDLGNSFAWEYMHSICGVRTSNKSTRLRPWLYYVFIDERTDGRTAGRGETNAERVLKRITYINWKDKKHCIVFLPGKLNRCGEKYRCITCDRGAAGRDDVQDNSFRKW